MAAHAAVPVRHHGSLSWALPVALGALYGFYAGFLRRQHSPLNWGDVLFGLIAGLVLAGLAYTLGRYQHTLPRELRAAAYGALCGVAMGFLYSQSGDSVLKCVGIGVTLAAAMTAASFYIFYRRED
ncbi:hypothetical protein OG883_32520 [Streptomyces sp. NBC_01142]|uniref:hypothetical protein n=1 Tax=Streptomyces sp. NBC_01142 TaxID=2975865 RepID=UPI00224F6095|nr:hypothetical protein [Streptomyces sp. NBC_01142]MCX4824499.1 hypothetical protein [Streptomyces sp. NBC_01142]